MQYVLTHYYAALFVMLLLMVASAFFSAAEAAYFTLSRDDRKRLAEGGPIARLANSLLDDPERLLASILLGHQFANLLFFMISTIIVFQLQRDEHYAEVGIFATVSLFTVIIVCEMLPKDIGVLCNKWFAVVFAVPLSVVLGMLKPLFPWFETTNILLKRLIFPKLKPEAYLKVDDIEHAIDLSKGNADLHRREQNVLQNILHLSNITAEELMCPRLLLHFFRPPVTFDDIIEEFDGEHPRTGYLLISEKDSDELASAVSLSRFQPNEQSRAARLTTHYVFDEYSNPVIFVPWSLSVSGVLNELHKSGKTVAAVLSEHGETIGVLTREDICEFLFGRQHGRSQRFLNRVPIRQIEPEVWHVTGLANLRRLERYFHITFSSHSSVTISGLLQERLERFPEVGDSIQIDQMQLTVLEINEDEGLLIELKKC